MAASNGIDIYYSRSSIDPGQFRRCLNFHQMLMAKVGAGGPKIKIDGATRYEAIRSKQSVPCWHKIDMMTIEEKKDVYSRAGVDQKGLRFSPFPLLFKDGFFIGGWEKITELNEEGRLDGALGIEGMEDTVKPPPYETESRDAILTWAPQVEG